MDRGTVLGVAEAMRNPSMTSFPVQVRSRECRSFAEQVKHELVPTLPSSMKLKARSGARSIAKGWPGCSETKAELVKYLARFIRLWRPRACDINAANALRVSRALRRAEYAAGDCGRAVWHIADHYGQIVELFEENGSSAFDAKIWLVIR